MTFFFNNTVQTCKKTQSFALEQALPWGIGIQVPGKAFYITRAPKQDFDFARPMQWCQGISHKTLNIGKQMHTPGFDLAVRRQHRNSDRRIRHMGRKEME